MSDELDWLIIPNRFEVDDVAESLKINLATMLGIDEVGTVGRPAEESAAGFFRGHYISSFFANMARIFRIAVYAENLAMVRSGARDFTAIKIIVDIIVSVSCLKIVIPPQKIRPLAH